MAKFALVVYLAGYLARNQAALATDAIALVRPLALVGLLCILLLAQPDFGSVVVLAAVTGGVLFLAGARLRHFLLIVVVAGALLAMISVLQPYRLQRHDHVPRSVGRSVRERLSADTGAHRIRPWRSVRAWSRRRHSEAQLSAGSAQRLHLRGDRRRTGTRWRACRVRAAGRPSCCGSSVSPGRRSQEGRPFAAYIAYGTALLLGIQCIINIGVNTGTLPTKGLTLPFISYGGNSLIVCCALLGLVLRVQLERGRSR